jgi:hypothetical protein
LSDKSRRFTKQSVALAKEEQTTKYNVLITTQLFSKVKDMLSQVPKKESYNKQVNSTVVYILHIICRLPQSQKFHVSIRFNTKKMGNVFSIICYFLLLFL